MFKNCWRRIYANPFETNVALFCILNAMLTFSPKSAVLAGLWNLLGVTAPLLPTIQIIAGALVVIGISAALSNLEAAGLIMISSIFFVRGLILTTDGNVNLSDVNNVIIALLVIAASCKRINQIAKDQIIIHLIR